MAKIVTLTKGGIEKLIKAAGTVSPTSQKLAQYDGNGCIATNEPRFALDCVNKSYLESKLNGLGGGGGSASGTSTPTANKIAAYDENGRLHSTPKPENDNFIIQNEVVTFSDLTNPRLNDAYRYFFEFKNSVTPFRVKLTSADPITGGRVNLPIPGSDFQWITRTTGAGGGYEYELRAGNAYQVSWSIYGKAYFRSYNLFEDGTGFWNVSGTGENWKSETVIIWRNNGKPNIWLEHNGWQKGPGRIAVLSILPLYNVYI